VRLKDALRRKKFVITSEIQAPMEDDNPEKLVENLKRIKGRVDGVSVMEVELEGIVGDSIKTCEILQNNRFNAIYQTTTRASKGPYNCP
jgi:methylenetetrahydrofolate reductase (NADPH)